VVVVRTVIERKAELALWPRSIQPIGRAKLILQKYLPARAVVSHRLRVIESFRRCFTLQHINVTRWR